jgi:D-glycero-D-manno-heptose 1,7-bisphosphate phosphatase
MKIVVLDRDGVINTDSDKYIKSAQEWVPIPGSLQAISELHAAGFKVVVVTNQSGLGRKIFDEFSLANIHHKLRSMVEEEGGFVDGIFYCPHTPQDKCGCRKPATGLLVQVEQELQCSLAGCYLVGDSYKDLNAALAFGMKPVLVRTGKGSVTEQTIKRDGLDNVPIFTDLASAVRGLVLQ